MSMWVVESESEIGDDVEIVVVADTWSYNNNRMNDVTWNSNTSGSDNVCG